MKIETIEGYRLSPQQQHLWSLQQRHPSQPYRAQCTVIIEGDLDPTVLTAAINNLVSRHQILRTTFHHLEGMTFPVQVIDEIGVPPPEELDLSGAGSAVQRSTVENLLVADRSRAGDLSQGPLLSLWLLKMSSSEHLLVVTLPSLCADPSGLKNLVRELSRCYAACLGEEELTDETLPYIVIAEWQNELLEREDTEAGRAFWRKRYRADLIKANLPFEAPADEHRKFESRSITIEIEPETTAKVAAVSSSYNCSISTFLMTCWQVLLSRLTGQSEVLMGAASDGRTDAELEHVLGLMTKYLPLFLHLDAQSRFSRVMGQVEDATREAREWQEAYGWDQLGATPAGEIPFVPFCFEFEERPLSYSAGDVSFKIDHLLSHTDNFALKLSCVREADSLFLTINYNSDSYQVDDVEGLAKQLRRVIASAIADPESSVSRLEIVSEDERGQLLLGLNNTESEYASEKCLQELFEEQVERTPEAEALVHEEQRLSYGELNRRANRLAHYLRGRGVGPEQVVGLLLERSVEMVVAILGVLKAGGAYLPLDPGYPRERLSFMLADSGASLLVTEREFVEKIREVEAALVCLAECEELAGESEENPEREVVAENLAYVIYTSGSTGQPKAVVVTHRPPVNLLQALRSTVYEGESLEGRRASLNASFSFDASVQQWLLLLAGASLYLIPERLRSDGPGLLQYLREQQVEIFDCTPSQLRVLLSSGLLDGSGRAPHVLLVAGEAIEAGMWQELEQQEEGKRIYNIYGPTECCVDVTACLVDGGGCRRPVIGKPLSNYEVYVLDEWQRAVPMWVRGELYIGGAGLARGYHGRAELSAERFGPHPYSQQEGARLYRTGDLGRYLGDGSIEFLGRGDGQVKVRGYRVELGEVEAVLRGCAGVREAVVQLRERENGEGEGGEERLVGYVVAEEEGGLRVEQLRGEMGERVPDYMIPGVFVMLDRLPLNSSGKVERRELPEPERQRPQLGVGYVAPRTEAEEALVEIWQEVLGLEQVGVEDNFFDLGGHSLLATQVISRVREAFRTELPLRIFFETPTVASLAETITQSDSENGDDKTLEEILREIEELPADENLPALAERAARAGKEGEI
jgi:amino acid adenylation domain-containing protein